MNYRGIVRLVDGTKQKYDIVELDSADEALAMLKRDVPNVRVALVAISGGRDKKRKAA